MKCPHCGIEPAVFQAIEEIAFRPTIENWVFDRPSPASQESKPFYCVECEGLVRIDQKRRIITLIDSTPIFDEVVLRIIEVAKQKRDELVPIKVVEILRKKNFKKIHRLMSGSDLLSSIYEQKP